MKIDMLSVNDKNGLDRVYILLNSIKQTKQADTTISYHLILEDVLSNKLYFSDLISLDFNIEFILLTPFLDRINIPKAKFFASPNKYTMIRCLTPSFFSSIDKMLYLDTDIVLLQAGIEDFWNTDIEGYYMAGCEDVIVTKYVNLLFERKNTRNPTNYINAGVILFNYKQIREEGLDKTLVDFCWSWNLDKLKPYYLDQSLLNFLFREKIKLVDYKYNDFSLVCSTIILPYLRKYLNLKYGYLNIINSLSDAVIVHFLGEAKPWLGLNEKVTKLYLYYGAAKEIWKHIREGLLKNETEEV